MLAKIGLGFGCFLVFSTAYLMQDGFVHVAVDDWRPGGDHIHMIVPAVLAPLGVDVVPQKKLEHLPRELNRWLPTLRSASAELAKIPDAVLVEVTDDREHVRVAKSGDGLDIDVQDPGEHVHVWVPLSAVYDTLDTLQSRLVPYETN
jgi:hypothetical protein